MRRAKDTLCLAAGYAIGGFLASPVIDEMTFRAHVFASLMSLIAGVWLLVREVDRRLPDPHAKPDPPDPELREAERTRSVPRWRPIADAPTDGTVIDADSGDGTPMAVRWAGERGRKLPGQPAMYCVERSGWVSTMDGRAVEPKRWMA